MSAALERLGRQAEALDFFDEITLFTEHDLSAEFTSRMGRYLTPSCRGFGYWSWKPWSIHHVLQEMEEGDRLLYLEIGVGECRRRIVRVRSFGMEGCLLS